MTTANVSAAGLPHWDLTPFFPGLDSPEFAEAVTQLIAGIERLEEQIAAAPAAETITPEVVSAYDALTETGNTVADQISLIEAYAYGFLSVNSRDELAQAKASELQILMARFSKVQSRITAWTGALDIETLIAQSTVAADNAFLVRKTKIEAEHMMSQAEEDLAADLTLSGGSAFSRLHGDLSSQIVATVEKTLGEPETLPISEIRNLALDPDREVRQRAYAAEIGAWKQWETPLAATLNGVTGEHGVLAARRGWDDVLDESLFQNHIDRKTLDAMLGAAREAFPDIRRYWKAKATALGLEQLAWNDITAPLSQDDRVWSWDDAVTFINEQFGSFSPRMRALSERAFHERWIDAEPRVGKAGGAFCMGVRGDESRILANYSPSYDGVSTLGHELGHAYHNVCLADVSAIQRLSTPMTLAETASTFCETIMRKAAIANGSAQEQLAILEGALQDAGQIVVDITSRFLFEQSVYARRKDRELSADEFSQLMLDAQAQTYGDAIAADERHPYMWAVKGHYYAPGYAYYNYPYMFGLLFGVGLYAQYTENPETFRTNYDDLLASTGSADAATLAARFGFDIQSGAFWEKSLNVIREDIDTFVALIDQRSE